MKRMPIELLSPEGDGKVQLYLQTPSYYGLQLVDELRAERALQLGQPLEQVPASLDMVLAALLTDLEPLDERGNPAKLWRPVEVAKRIPMEFGIVDKLWGVVQALLEDATPKAPSTRKGKGGAAAVDPTAAARGDESASVSADT